MKRRGRPKKNTTTTSKASVKRQVILRVARSPKVIIALENDNETLGNASIETAPEPYDVKEEESRKHEEDVDFLIQEVRKMMAQFRARIRGEAPFTDRKYSKLGPEVEKKIEDLLQINYDYIREYAFIRGQLRVYEEIYDRIGSPVEAFAAENDDEGGSSFREEKKCENFPDSDNVSLKRMKISLKRKDAATMNKNKQMKRAR